MSVFYCKVFTVLEVYTHKFLKIFYTRRHDDTEWYTAEVSLQNDCTDLFPSFVINNEKVGTLYQRKKQALQTKDILIHSDELKS